MNTRDHTAYREEVGAYLLGALTEGESRAFESHLSECSECREEVARLRSAAEALPRSVEQMEPPPGLKAALMEVVDREAPDRRGAPAAARTSWRERLRGRLGPMRPALVAGALALGLLAGFGVAQFADGGDDTRTVVATVDQSRAPDASARLQVQGDGEGGGILRVQGMPSLARGRVYQAWVQRDGMVVPQPTFEVGNDGGGAVAVTDDLSDARAVLVTREPRGGARAPSERPVLSVPL
jgi:anti-sigma factor RsiW